jgi:hypothetical protein
VTALNSFCRLASPPPVKFNLPQSLKAQTKCRQTPRPMTSGPFPDSPCCHLKVPLWVCFYCGILADILVFWHPP